MRGVKLSKLAFELGISKTNPEGDVIRNEEIFFIRTALSKLNEKERTILLLYQDGLSHSQIAEIINVKRISIGRLLARALEKFSRILNEEGYFNETH